MKLGLQTPELRRLGYECTYRVGQKWGHFVLRPILYSRNTE